VSEGPTTISEMQAELSATRAKVEELRRYAAELQGYAAELQAHYQASTSWKVAQPVRAAKMAARRLAGFRMRQS